MAERGYDPVYGARPMKRTLQRLIETPMAQRIIGGEIQEGSVVDIDEEKGEILFRISRGEVPESELNDIEVDQ